MDLVDLRTFETVARLGSMSRAASELHTVQSNVTARIRALEHELGTALFERHARGVLVTPAGRRVLPIAARIAKLVAEACSAARDDGTPSGNLRLGSLETTAALRLSPLLTEFAATYPDVRLAVSSGTTAGLLRDVVDARLDGAFVAGPVAHRELAQEAVFEEELVLVSSPALTSSAQLADIAELRTVVFHYGCSYRQRLENYLASIGVVSSRPLEFGSLDAILSCVAAGVGVTLLPRGVVAEGAARRRVALHRIPKELAHVQTLFIRRKDAYLSSAMRAFVHMAGAFHAVGSATGSRRSARAGPARCVGPVSSAASESARVGAPGSSSTT